MANAGRETLNKYFPQGGLSELGFKPGGPSGYAFERGKLFAFHVEERRTPATEGEALRIRRTLLITDGQEWFAGGRNGEVSSREMLDDLLHGVKNGGAQRYKVMGAELPSVLADPLGISDIEPRPEPPVSPKINGVKGHFFE